VLRPGDQVENQLLRFEVFSVPSRNQCSRRSRHSQRSRRSQRSQRTFGSLGLAVNLSLKLVPDGALPDGALPDGALPYGASALPAAKRQHRLRDKQTAIQDAREHVRR